MIEKKKKLLTNESGMFYAESLKTATIGFRTRQICDFFVFANWRMRAENILNISQGFIVAAFSESATFHNCVAFLKKATKMTNTIINTTESTLQSLYRYYREIKSTWYKGEYTQEQENIYFGVFSALEEALIKLPAQSSADYRIKLRILKNLIEFPLETNNGIDLKLAQNREVKALALIEQIAAE